MGFPALQSVQQLGHQVVDIDQLQLRGRIVDLNGQIVCNVVAEGGHDAVIVGTAPLAEQVGQPVDQHLGTGLLPVVEKQLLPCQLGLAVFAACVTPLQACLHRGGQHHGAGVSAALQGVQQSAGKAEIAGHKFRRILRAVDARQMKDKIRLLTEFRQQRRVRVDIIFVDLSHGEAGSCPVLSVSEVFQRADEVFPYKACRAGDKNIHQQVPPKSFSLRSSRFIPSTSSLSVLWEVYCSVCSRLTLPLQK